MDFSTLLGSELDMALILGYSNRGYVTLTNPPILPSLRFHPPTTGPELRRFPRSRPHHLTSSFLPPPFFSRWFSHSYKQHTTLPNKPHSPPFQSQPQHRKWSPLKPPRPSPRPLILVESVMIASKRIVVVRDGLRLGGGRGLQRFVKAIGLVTSLI
jgi:hypothetical protein